MEGKESSTEVIIPTGSGNEFTSDDSKNIVISSIEDIPVIDENSEKNNLDGKNLHNNQKINNSTGEDLDDDAKALAEIEKEGEAYNARKQTKKKPSFSFEILSSKSARLRHLIQMNNSNKANNNGNIKDLTPTTNLKAQQGDKDKNSPTNSEATKPTTTYVMKTEEEHPMQQDGKTDDESEEPSTKQKQQRPERTTSRFGPNLNEDTENASSNLQNLKYPKCLPTNSKNNGKGLLPTPECKPNSIISTKFYSKENLKDVETDSLGRIRRNRY